MSCWSLGKGYEQNSSRGVGGAAYIIVRVVRTFELTDGHTDGRTYGKVQNLINKINFLPKMAVYTFPFKRTIHCT